MKGSWDTIETAFMEALRLVAACDPRLMAIVGMTLQVSLGALFLATLQGLPVGALCGLGAGPRFRGLIRGFLYTGMGLPPVVVGLAVYLFLSRSGPLTDLEWLFTPAAMITAQTLLALPLVMGLTMAAVEAVDPALKPQLVSLGATGLQVARWTLFEARGGVLTAIAAAFGAAISEVGAVMLVGGNIEGQTRVLTTAIVLETRRGEFSLAMALGLILVFLTLAINFLLVAFGEGRSPRARG